MIRSETIKPEWNNTSLQVFWGELAPSDHVVQMYENDRVFLDSLEGFVGSGLIAGDAVIIIATEEHRKALEERMENQGFDMAMLTASNCYIALDAQETLNRFMINNWPDETLFFDLVYGLLEKMKKHNGKVRAFGEMVALLWAQGLNGATVQLENLWNQVHKQVGFTLFCAYPRIGFTGDIQSSMQHICATHTKIIDGTPRPSTEIFYKEVH
jgi:MEDS: MEthanogen/methylotroph, DcmR Sensory domain